MPFFSIDSPKPLNPILVPSVMNEAFAASLYGSYPARRLDLDWSPPAEKSPLASVATSDVLPNYRKRNVRAKEFRVGSEYRLLFGRENGSIQSIEFFNVI